MQEFDLHASTATLPEPVKNRWSIFAWALLYLLIAGALQFNIPYPWDDDTAYHAVVGKLIREHGILHAFPWTPFSWLAEHYADKELLFHLIFVPFASLNWVTAAQIVGTLTGAALLLTLYLILRTENVRFSGLWALVPLACSVLFLFRFVLVRPHHLSIILALVVLWAAVRGRLVILAAASAIYPWAYVAFWQIPLLLLIASETARFLSGERVRWKPAAAVIGGIALGVALHPNAVNLLGVNWMHMVDVLFKQGWGERVGFELGGEFEPYPLPAWVQGLLFSVLMTMTAVIYAWRNRRHDLMTLAFGLAALGFCTLTIKSARFAEYFVPFSASAMALTSRSIKWRYLPHTIIGISIAWMALVQPHILSDLSKRPNDMPPRIETFLRQQIPVGAQVFTTDWDHTGWLMLALPDRRFIVGLDPTFFYLKDPELYRLWYKICREAPSGSAETIRRRFGARYVLGLNIPGTSKLFSQLSSERGVRTLLVSDIWLLFDLGEPLESQTPRSDIPGRLNE
ncbi:MAG TPA: hypothetical protein VMM54_04460 [Nitrospirota bacterium]|nr:hypothetical protein [Nitrospirota bacterium]